jgi:hypothetical protein
MSDPEPTASSTQAHRALIERFYRSFARRDSDVMFTDPMFGKLQGPVACEMWRMLCDRGHDLQLEWRDVSANDVSGRAAWTATYTFERTGRQVKNAVDATFVFRDGLIAEHRDAYDLYKWMRMALGINGRLLGWTPQVQARAREQAQRRLAEYVEYRSVRNND